MAHNQPNIRLSCMRTDLCELSNTMVSLSRISRYSAKTLECKARGTHSGWTVGVAGICPKEWM